MSSIVFRLQVKQQKKKPVFARAASPPQPDWRVYSSRDTLYTSYTLCRRVTTTPPPPPFGRACACAHKAAIIRELWSRRLHYRCLLRCAVNIVGRLGQSPVAARPTGRYVPDPRDLRARYASAVVTAVHRYGSRGRRNSSVAVRGCRQRLFADVVDGTNINAGSTRQADVNERRPLSLAVISARWMRISRKPYAKPPSL